MDNQKCHICINCQLTDKWESLYKDFLKKYPQEEEFINQQRKVDQILACRGINETPDYQTDADPMGGDTIEDYL